MTSPFCEEQPDFPAIIVEAGFGGGASTVDYLHLDDVARGKLDTGTLAPDSVWEDISEWVHRVGVSRVPERGASSPILRYEAGTAQVDLNNSDRRFDPTNLSGPYVSAGLTQVTPMRAVRVRAVWQGVTYPLFRGFADEWDITYEGDQYSLCRLSLTDAVKVFSHHDRAAVGSVGGGENAGARITRILNSVSWPATDRVIATGDSTLQATTLEGVAWSEMQLVAETEIGESYVDAAGRAVFRNRQASMEQPRSMSANALFSGTDTISTVPTAINWFTNPSIELNADRFQAAGLPAPTVARTSTRSHSGTWAIEVTWAGGETFLPSVWAVVSGLTDGRAYTWSAWIYVPAGSPDISVFEPSVSFGQFVDTKDTWVRVTHPFTQAGDPDSVLGFYAQGGGGAGTKLFVDDVMVTEGGVDQVPVYFDGGSPFGEWDGTAHASISRQLPELPAADVKLSYTDQTIANLIRVTRVGGTEQVVTDPASQQLNLIRSHKPPSELLMETDQAALDYASFLLYQSKDPELRFTILEIHPQADPANLYPQVLGREFGDRIRVKYDPPGGGTITREVFIRGVIHSIEQGEWVTWWVLQSTTKWAFLTLDHATLGKLNENALGL